MSNGQGKGHTVVAYLVGSSGSDQLMGKLSLVRGVVDLSDVSARPWQYAKGDILGRRHRTCRRTNP